MLGVQNTLLREKAKNFFEILFSACRKLLFSSRNSNSHASGVVSFDHSVIC